MMWFASSRYCSKSDPCQGIVDALHSHGPDYDTQELAIAPRIIPSPSPRP